jgi:hypothetical protein
MVFRDGHRYDHIQKNGKGGGEINARLWFPFVLNQVVSVFLEGR